ncbi:MAG: RNA polymerase subunit sigma [Actinobacteria bacterium 13_2_20CM_2_72_6]|nr:MAG: RNA polymerase subunit sigma [Actinobacteria bacterium 13_2_20CM_2_72_6]
MRELADALAAAREGDEAGFTLLWRAYQPGLLRYLRVVVGAAAEDVASETWLQVARDLSGYRGGPEAFQVWLFRVARHRAIDDRRWVRRRPEELVDPALVPERISGDAWTQAVEHFDTEWALAVIGSLPPDQAEAVLLRVVVGLDVAGTAAVLRKRPGAVRVAALRGLRRLAEHTEVRQRRPAVPSAVPEGGVTRWDSGTPG